MNTVNHRLLDPILKSILYLHRKFSRSKCVNKAHNASTRPQLSLAELTRRHVTFRLIPSTNKSTSRIPLHQNSLLAYSVLYRTVSVEVNKPIIPASGQHLIGLLITTKLPTITCLELQLTTLFSSPLEIRHIVVNATVTRYTRLMM